MQPRVFDHIEHAYANTGISTRAATLQERADQIIRPARQESRGSAGRGPGRGAGQRIGSGARGAGCMQPPMWRVHQFEAQQGHQAASAQVSLTILS